MFISLEGIEGSGKTTQARYLADFLNTRGMECVLTREPGGTAIGSQIRAILLNPDNRNLAPMAELLLYMADRVQHLNERILPALADGKVVLCDRFFDATLVYQGTARGLPVEQIRRLHQWTTDGMTPDLTLLLDLPAEIGLRRAWQQLDNGSRTLHESRFEKETLSFHETIRTGYLDLARSGSRRFRVIDAAGDEDDIRREIARTVSRYIKGLSYED